MKRLSIKNRLENIKKKLIIINLSIDDTSFIYNSKEEIQDFKENIDHTEIKALFYTLTSEPWYLYIKKWWLKQIATPGNWDQALIDTLSEDEIINLLSITYLDNHVKSYSSMEVSNDYIKLKLKEDSIYKYITETYKLASEGVDVEDRVKEIETFLKWTRSEHWWIFYMLMWELDRYYNALDI